MSVVTQSIFRILYGILLLGTLISLLPNWKRFFVSQRWKGYVQQTPWNDLLHRPSVIFGVLIIWISSGIFLVIGKYVLAAAFINFVFCYYFFIHLRWKSLFRGMGAPGFMSAWLAAAVLLLEYTHNWAINLKPVSLLVLQVDFAIIMLTAGLYKMTAGFPKNEGMEYGLVNPMWGYWWRFYSKLPSNHWLFKLNNYAAWITEIIAAVLMLIPQTRLLGALIIGISFLYVLTQIRLKFLGEMVMVCVFLFIPQGHFLDFWLNQWIGSNITTYSITSHQGEGLFNAFLELSLWVYLILRPLSVIGLGYNFYFKKTFNKFLQKALNLYANVFGIILWRVFTKELINFYVEIYEEDISTNERRLVSHFSNPFNFRYNHVSESITITTIFTAKKYFRAQTEIFQNRLIQYARSLIKASGARLFAKPDALIVFKYIQIEKTKNKFIYTPIIEYSVDPAYPKITEKPLSDKTILELAPPSHAVQVCQKQGSYI